MRYFVTIVFMLSSVLVIAQKNDDYSEIPEFKRPNSLTWQQVSGLYIAEVGVFDRVKLQLNLSGNFTNVYAGRYDRDTTTGKWELTSEDLILRYNEQKLEFDILEFCGYYILVPSLQKSEFIKLIKVAIAEAKKEKIKDEYFVTYILGRVKDLLTRKIYPSR
ncbi:MAG: hypothetical protein E6H09_01920 [Bacteroidetes bacterium]|jgi:hypothetical protein|nr:MAG: hypothetical protein E6H09_01920 [Bacteroidota bacterium]